MEAQTENPVSILMVEDDPNLGYLLRENFKSKGYNIHLCKDGEEGYQAFLNYNFRLCILDVMLPKKDGFTLAKEIRKKDDIVPIIFLTAKSMEEDKFKGFDVGGDDYITKPFSAQELLLRIKAILKRTRPAGGSEAENRIYHLGNYKFDYHNRLLTIGEDEKRLSTKEAELLKIFCDHKNSLLSRKIILTSVWGTDDYFASKSMDVYLTKLRKILRGDSAVEIQNVHGTGFKMIVN